MALLELFKKLQEVIKKLIALVTTIADAPPQCIMLLNCKTFGNVAAIVPKRAILKFSILHAAGIENGEPVPTTVLPKTV